MGKMKIIKSILIAVSIEFLAVLVAIGITILFPQFIENIGNLFTQGWQMYCVLVGLPLGGLIFGFKCLNSLLHPWRDPLKLYHC